MVVGLSPLDMGPGTLLAVAAALGAALSYAFAGTFVRRRLHGVAGIEIATGQLVSASIILLPFAALSGAPGVPSVGGAASLVGVAVISTALAWPLYFRVLGRTTATAASTVTFIVPAFAILWGAIALGRADRPRPRRRLRADHRQPRAGARAADRRAAPPPSSATAAATSS